jgi:DNA-binding transcriptional ArsR family regulator
MDDVYVLKEPEQLKAMSDPLRVAVLGETIGGPVTIAQVAEKLGEPPRKLYYHFTELERLGLIRVVETRQKGNLIEKLYQAVAKFISVDWTLFNKTTEGQEYLVRNVNALLHNSALDFQRHIQEGHLDPEQMDKIWPLYTVMRLSSEDVERFRRGLRDLLEQFKGKRGEGEPSASLTLLFYPFTPPDGEPGKQS